jgi:hypothetical protein
MEWLHNTFIVKISDGTSLHPRGYIEHLSTQERVYFDCFELMNHFISKCLKMPPSDEIETSANQLQAGVLSENPVQQSPGGEQ